jgi:hypothetical protein
MSRIVRSKNTDTNFAVLSWADRFSDGDTKLLDTDNMTSEERRQRFQRDEN